MYFIVDASTIIVSDLYNPIIWNDKKINMISLISIQYFLKRETLFESRFDYIGSQFETNALHLTAENCKN